MELRTVRIKKPEAIKFAWCKGLLRQIGYKL
jgi:hypothetical protein